MKAARNLTALAAALLAAAPALGYIPSVTVLLHRAALRVNEGARTRDVTLSGTLQIGDAAPAPRVLTLRFPLSCRFEGGAQARGTVTQPLPSSAAGNPEQELIELACPLIAYRGLKTADAETALGAVAYIAGADLSATAVYDRLGDRVALVVGAPPRQADRPQLWLYKDTHAPARLIARRDGHLEDLRLLEYGNPAAAEWFPRILELVRDGKTSARFEVLETKGFRETGEEEDDDRE
ncbi:MAG TPA: hypothetical protein VKB92_07385 [Myxococcales bacterium]|nr:hypothetical protein [Myxococcales bacterium]